MNIPEAIKAVLGKHGTSQAWVISRMNSLAPELNMNRTKFSAIVCGNRKMSGDELLAFCKATETNPDFFCDVAAAQQPGA